MNRMKRKLSICLALIMALTVFGGLSITVMAEDYTYNATVPNDASPYEVRVAPNTYVNINFRVTNGYSAVVKIGIDNGTKSERVHLGIYTGTMAFPYESAVSSKTKNIVVTDLSDTVLMQIPITVSWTTDPTPTPNPPSGGSDSSSTSSKSHTHSYSWEDVRPATEDDNGEIAYKCSCGEVLYRVPTSAYYVFNKNTQDKIKNAKQGATVKIETSRWISFHKMVMQALADRPDVSLEVSFLDGEYKGNRVSFTIPAGTDTLSLLDENGFSGFLYLAGKFGTAN